MPAMPDAGGASPAPTIRPQSPSPDAPPLSASPDERSEVERYTHLLNHLCETQQVPNEFWPHHGSLSKEIREETEAALKQKERPATAICTTTLELGSRQAGRHDRFLPVADPQRQGSEAVPGQGPARPEALGKACHAQ